jgi:hypothetical protein
MANSLGEFRREFRRDPGPNWAMIVVLAVLALLMTAGIVWLVVKPDGNLLGRAATALFFACLVPITVFGIRQFWRRLHERFRLHDHGLEYFDGDRTHPISWDQIAEIREATSTVKVYGLTASGPEPEVELVTDQGLHCSLSSDVLDLKSLAPVVSASVHAHLGEKAERQLQRGGAVPFGPLSVSTRGIEIAAPAPKAWWESLKTRFSQNVHPPVIRPCRLSWEEVDHIRIGKARRGDALSDRTTYCQIEIGAGGDAEPVFVYPIPEFANFFVFLEVLEALNHPIESMPEAVPGSIP